MERKRSLLDTASLGACEPLGDRPRLALMAVDVFEVLRPSPRRHPSSGPPDPPLGGASSAVLCGDRHAHDRDRIADRLLVGRVPDVTHHPAHPAVVRGCTAHRPGGSVAAADARLAGTGPSRVGGGSSSGRGHAEPGQPVREPPAPAVRVDSCPPSESSPGVR
jgi:hypothetical protein